MRKSYIVTLMKITKYEHACLVIQEKGRKLVIDPGEFSQSLTDYTNIDALVITHAHFDHLDKSKVELIVKNSPNVKIFAPSDAIDSISHKYEPMLADQIFHAGNFNLRFFGGQHAMVHKSLPIIQNFGVLVNNTLYYPGDSFTTPDRPVRVLAIPANAPWMKVGEAMDFIEIIKPKMTFPTHNFLLSDAGQIIADRLLSQAEKFGTVYRHLSVGESLDIVTSANH
jgi:L-ascorbate metabolism protein UlaG (beta-lactamase superfamily)